MIRDGAMHEGWTWGTGLGTAILVLFIVVVMAALIKYIFFD
jgi:hypothetical protein